MFKDNVMIPYAYRGVRVVAGRSAGPLFYKKVTVEGAAADEDLSFNIMIPLRIPTSPQPLQGIVHVCKEHYMFTWFCTVYMYMYLSQVPVPPVTVYSKVCMRHVKLGLDYTAARTLYITTDLEMLVYISD